jgi:hypothetical protein
MHRVQARAVRLVATNAVEIAAGVVLPPGHYSGIEWRTGLETSGGITMTAPQYKIELTADQLADMGAADTPNLDSKDIDVTKFVRSVELIAI